MINAPIIEIATIAPNYSKTTKKIIPYNAKKILKLKWLQSFMDNILLNFA